MKVITKYVTAAVLLVLELFALCSGDYTWGDRLFRISLSALSIVAGFFVIYVLCNFFRMNKRYNMAENLFLIVIVLWTFVGVDLLFSKVIGAYLAEVGFAAGAALSLLLAPKKLTDETDGRDQGREGKTSQGRQNESEGKTSQV